MASLSATTLSKDRQHISLSLATSISFPFSSKLKYRNEIRKLSRVAAMVLYHLKRNVCVYTL